MEDINQRLVIRLSGMHCVGCYNRIEQTLSQLGAEHIDLDISTNIGKIDYLGDEGKAKLFIDAILKIGYQAEFLAIINNES